MSCVFCDIINGRAPGYVVYEDEDVVAILDKHPAAEGHILVMPRRHHENIYELPDDLLCKVIKATKKVALAVKESLGATGVRVLQNNGADAGQVVFHIHFHVIPFYGNYRWNKHELTPEEAERVVSRVKPMLSRVGVSSNAEKH
ncbi:MAG: HIT family protein [Thermocladium sp.]|jgi:histidine triad (HIT) family protein